MRAEWDSREGPGPSTEVELSRPSTRRVLTAGAIVLAVIAPTLDTADHPAEAGATLPAFPAVAETPGFAFGAAFADRPSARQRSSRSAIRRLPAVRPVARPVSRPVLRKIRPVRKSALVRTETRSVTQRRVTAHRKRSISRRILRTLGVRGGMSAVIAFARTQIGKSYVSGGNGAHGYDCSGFTRAAYARAGLHLPHSSGAQAARARAISRAQARPGDLVVGAGHVGLYMGGGMMIDAGNRRTGVVYRPMYGGLRIKRF